MFRLVGKNATVKRYTIVYTGISNEIQISIFELFFEPLRGDIQIPFCLEIIHVKIQEKSECQFSPARTSARGCSLLNKTERK